LNLSASDAEMAVSRMRQMTVISERPHWTSDDDSFQPAADDSLSESSSGASRMSSNGGDLEREVYAILGIPFDAVNIAGVLHAIDAAASRSLPFLLSTPNLNFAIAAQTNRDFRDALLTSDLCPPDGMPIIWLARLMGLPLRRRTAGSDVYEALKLRTSKGGIGRVFFLGGEDGVAIAASQKLNSERAGLVCTGALCPGFGTIDDLSTDKIISQINRSQADFLIVALGAEKGQEWLRLNHSRLTVPVRSHLGAVVKFQAGKVKRAPGLLRQFGLEWLWRIKEEPQLWSRYWHDGWRLLWLLLTRVAPIALNRFRHHRRYADRELQIECSQSAASTNLRLSGDATAANAKNAAPSFRGVLAADRSLVIDLSETRVIDARFFGLLLMVRKIVMAQRSSLQFVGVSSTLRRMFWLHGVDFLLDEGRVPAASRAIERWHARPTDRDDIAPAVAT
jgi:N-acetylglucosaminyldiphosphoundecaprenol N-acetyl-beta-D-mannosaminyltransferase